MSLSRRTFLTTAAAATVGTAAGAVVTLGSAPADAASPPGDVVGKIAVGYQGWFACIGDGAPINTWWHWSHNESQTPSPTNNVIKAWPDLREYTHLYNTAYDNLGNGRPAALFSSYDQQTVDTHFLWMQQNGCDTAALQRFNPNSPEGPTRDAMATKVRSSAETYGRKFYIMYDVTGWTNMQSEIKADWTNKMSAHTASAAYARQNGKPVVCIWGFGFDDPNHPWDAATCVDVVNWFKGQGCYVIGGVPRGWRTGDGGSRPGDPSRTRPTATPTASTTSPACCPGMSRQTNEPMATLRGGSSTTWSGSGPRGSTSPCSTSSARATRSARPPRTSP